MFIILIISIKLPRAFDYLTSDMAFCFVLRNGVATLIESRNGKKKNKKMSSKKELLLLFCVVSNNKKMRN